MFIAHRDPLTCPIGALAIYNHWLHDDYKLEEKMQIDWARNKSWRQVIDRLLTLLINLTDQFEGSNAIWSIANGTFA